MAAIRPYKGTEPYIFVSYSHRDTARVLEIIEDMAHLGFRVWYDEGIDPGTEWDDYIAGHVEECGCLVAFLSENYLHSQNCKDELQYARDLEKERLLIYLEPVELPRGMAMRMNRLQAIHAYTYSNKSDFHEKLFSAPCLKCTLDETKKQLPEPAKVPSPQGNIPQAAVHTATIVPQTTYARLNYPGVGIYEGDTLNSRRHGKGKFTWNNGDTYEGEWATDSKSGYGIYRWNSGTTYEGQWLGDKRTGHGKYTDKHGCVYEGSFLNNLRHGKGKQSRRDGSVYDGEWVSGKMHGQGKLTYADGSIYEGQWENEIWQGFGRYTAPDGIWYEGTFKDGKCIAKRFHSSTGSGLEEAAWAAFDFTQNPDGSGNILKVLDHSISNGTLPAATRSVASYSFGCCDNLTVIRIPEGVQTVGSGAFSKCENVKEVYIPASLTSLGYSPLPESGTLQRIVVDSGNPVLAMVDNCLIDRQAHLLVKGLSISRIPQNEGITEIGLSAFQDCAQLRYVQLPTGLTIVGSRAFAGCTGLTEVVVPEGVTRIGGWAFDGCANLRSITIPRSVTKLGDDSMFSHCPVFNGCSNLTIRGYAGSRAEAVAKLYHIPFVPIG